MVNKKYFICFLAGLLIAAVWGCATKPVPVPDMVRLSPSDYPKFGDDMNYSLLADSIEQSLVYLRRVPKDRKFRFGEDRFEAVHMIRSMELFLAFTGKNPSEKELNRFIRDNYLVYRSSGEPKTGKVLFTGYFEPLLSGSSTASDIFRYPVYGQPEDIATVDLGQFSEKLKGQKIIGRVDGKTFVPYYDRAEIEAGALENKAPVLAWVDDPVALFFLQIQGSGKVALPDGSFINIHYYGKNGRAYRSIGQLLIDEKKVPVERMSMQAIRQYLAEHPEDVDHVLNHNLSYVFFSIEKDGPLGALNVRLTPGRSIAVDRDVFPMSALAFIEVQKPQVAADGSGQISEWVDFSRFMVSQDTGGAIKTAGRTDIFWGNGPYAEIAAGHLKHRGNLYMLVLKP